MQTRLLALALLTAVLGCATTTTTTRTWDDPGGPVPVRTGSVASIRETVRRSEGDPAGGAVAGAAIGGVLGALLGGHGHHGHYRASPAGALFGAAAGAVVGAAASEGRSEERYYDVTVRFDDGGDETFVYPSWPPFRVGDPVQLTPYGLSPQ